MAKKQKWVSAETKRMIKAMDLTETTITFRGIRKGLKFALRFQFTPACENCDNPNCKESKSPALFYCSKQR
jgi:hypothetical protein